MEYSKEEAISVAQQFLIEVKALEKKYGMSFNSDTGDIYLSFKSTEEGKFWDSIPLDWLGDGSGIKVKELIDHNRKEKIKESALSKLTDEERKVLGVQ